MPLTINTRSYTIDDASSKNSVIYRDPQATAAQPSIAKLGRIEAKRTPTFNGVTKAEAKVSKTPLISDVPVPALLRAEGSVPVGMDDVELDLLIADFRSLVASAAFVDLVKGGKIYHG